MDNVFEITEQFRREHGTYRPVTAARKATSVARMLAALTVLLHRYTGEEAVRVHVSRRTSDDREVAGAHVEMAVHAELPLSVVVERAVAALEGGAVSKLLRNVPHGESLRLECAAAKIVARLRGGEARLVLEESQVVGLLSTKNPVRSAIQHWERVMSALTGDTRTSVGDIDLLTDDDRAVLAAWTKGEARPELWTDALLHELFEQRARMHPARVAVICGAASMTYGELNAKANQLARFLRDRGVGVGMNVAFQIPRSMDVYIALLGVMKAGATYVPLDPSYPRDRVLYVLSDAAVHTLITTAESLRALGPVPCRTLCLDVEWGGFVRHSTADLSRHETRATSQSLAYIIYTSGSTGKPKGVAIEHATATHLVRAEGRLFRVTADDRVYQGFSIAFDAAVEEVWLAFAWGGALVVGTAEMATAGAELSRMLTAHRVSVFSCVPTLLSMMDDHLPSVRLLILGGEACPHDLVKRFARPGRRMVNTYGPTEATVIATYADCTPTEPVTIGRPIPNYTTYILDSRGRQVPPGVAGEIYLGGAGLARGYVGKPALTHERFAVSSAATGIAERLYRTGDRGRFDGAGRIEFLGRADEQVKIRGYRVELSEIESAMMACAGVVSAVVALREDVPGVPALVGYIIPAAGTELSDDGLRQRLRTSLPHFMVPARIERLTQFPTLPSGKVNRKALPAPRAAALAMSSSTAARRNPVEGVIASAWMRALGLLDVPPGADFFDLGGHSLAAAHVVSELRTHPALAHVSMLDLYHHRTVERLAAFIGNADVSSSSPKSETAEVSSKRRRVDPLAAVRHAVCGAAQALSLYFLAGMYGIEWLGPYLAYAWLRHDGHGVGTAVLGSVIVAVETPFLLLFVALAAKWMLIGKYAPGRHRIWGFTYFRWWLAERIMNVAPLDAIAGTPLLNAYYRALGARIGSDVHLTTPCLGAVDLITVGSHTTIADEASVSGWSLEDGYLVFGTVTIGERCRVGERSVISHGVTLEDGSTVGALALVTAGTRVPGEEAWSGSPARRTGEARDPRLVPHPRTPAMGTVLYGVLAALLPLFLLAAFLPGFLVLDALERRLGGWSYLLATPAVSALFVLIVCATITIVKWTLLGRLKAGTYRLHGWFGIRKWFFDQLMGLSLDVVGGLYATMYLAPFYRALGVKLGKGAEVSTSPAFAPDLLEIEEGAFVADCALLSTSHVDQGMLTLQKVRVGKRSFVGNSAVVNMGASLPDDSLLGCLSISPDHMDRRRDKGASWLGAPAIALPKRQASTAFDVAVTFDPAPSLVLQRLAIEGLRVVVPPAAFMTLASLLIAVALRLRHHMSPVALGLTLPLLYLAFALAAGGVAIAVKWSVVGRYRASEKPLWSSFVWRTELVTAIHENLANTFLTGMIEGTPMLPWFFRALGSKIGSRVYLGSTELTEYDLVEIGDEATISADATLQTHLFEDRVMKMSTVRIGPRCTVGEGAVILYDTRMDEGASLGALSLLMKGENLPAGTRWEGTPAAPANRMPHAEAPARTETNVAGRPSALGRSMEWVA